MIRLFDECPACHGPIVVTECKCENCQLVMRGEFQPDQFSALSGDQQTFVRVFLRARGNLSEVEKVLGVSYPTIRNKLDEINVVLDRADAVKKGGPAAGSAPSRTGAAPVSGDVRQAILAQVAAGTITAAEALQMLRNV